MFGMGFMEIFLIAIVAIIALGPDKLPTAMVEIAKFIKKIKSGVEDAKSTLDNELNINEMKEEAAKYKAQIEDAKNTLNVKENMNLDLNNILNDENEPSKEKEELKEEPKEDENKEQVSLKEPKKKKKKDNSNKFKVNFDEEIKDEK
ncbi:twin-arginine translocase subunit TatB [Arcobacter sp. CECT 8983]|uniref:Sec-independent protein translocase protein TatB n=1 Tax=Arcobacter sp. CECT 8983 TaxID=2044508 RepID=UPI00100B295A|nr:Sec-independent protein translocase protein TatB [Arcobacter sp. CECT 8983]RXJ88370.1 twin-arginine translocase subunit TatB [Arcobacter sp. CECT 8983]